MNMTLREIVRVLNGQLILGDPKMKATHASVDSRTVEIGDLFFALKGARGNGHDYAITACRQGAAGVVVSRLDWLPSLQNFPAAVVQVEDPLKALQSLGQYLRTGFKGPVVGVTGSNGKTTTKQMIASVLKTLGPGLFTKGNFNSQIGLPVVLSESSPDHRWMVLEMGASEPGNVHALTEIAHPTIGVITSIGPAHLETFGTLAKIARTKWELMDALPSDGVAIVPWGEPALEPHIRSFTKRLVFFGEDSSCPVRASAVEIKETLNFMLHIGAVSTRVFLPVRGRFNVRNALASAAVGWVLNVPVEAIAEGLGHFEPPPMRMEILRHPSGAIFLNDAYNANPASMVNAVSTLMESYFDRRRIVVLGSMKELGEASEKLHFHLGAEVGKCALDAIYLFGPEAEATRDGAVAAGFKPDHVFHTNKIDELIKEVKRQVRPDVVILFKASRAMQLERVVEALKN
ncbi:MAG: UDP-N-acetylmuramoyl-tripeptide--D-alanyl-D-alanine ligase [Elusimicrobia bacterium]|nr:UDP-N-acetylmuramoyl-tripeptide--D-alanyl-D-alanine ligase [Candidatus Obscuribacterium magneticum]